MNAYRTRLIDPTKILTRREMAVVLAELKRKAERSPGTWLNLIIFRLASCCGLRVSELASLRLADVRVETSRPHLVIRRGAAKGGRSRTVPLWWDAGTLADLTAWKRHRQDQNAGPNDIYVSSPRQGSAGRRLSRHTLRKRFRTACKPLGTARLESLTIHHGRHTFISHALAGGRTLAEVRDCVGHANVYVTCGYLHVVVDEEERIGSLFAMK